MALNCVSLSAGDHGSRVASRPSHGDVSPPALALAVFSGDSFLLTRPEATHPGPPPRQTVRPRSRAESRRPTGGGCSPTRFIKAGDPGGRVRSRQARLSPYPTPGANLDLLRSVLRPRLIASGGVNAAGPAS